MSVCFTQRHTLLSLPQELSTLTIPITPRPPETAVFITEPLLCAANKVSPAPRLNTEIKLHSETEERERGEGEKCGVKWMKSLGCSQWWCLYSQLPPPLSDLVELFTCRSRRSMLVGRGSTKRSGSNSRQRQITQKEEKGGVCSHQRRCFIYSSALPGKCDRYHEEHWGFNVLFKCIQQKVEAFRIY